MALKEIEYGSKVYSLSYEILNPSKKKTILFLHGWGSSKEIMKQAFGKCFGDFKHIYLDLPGFGNSSIEEIITTQDYSSIVELFLKSLHIDELSCIVGHSFGGKVATLLNPANLTLLSSAGIVRKKSLKTKLKIILFKAFKGLLPKKFYKFFASDDVKEMSQTMYEILKLVVDEDFSKHFKNLTSKTVIFWGREDYITPLESGRKIKELIKGSEFYELGGDHFFFIKNSKFIEKRLVTLL